MMLALLLIADCVMLRGMMDGNQNILCTCVIGIKLELSERNASFISHLNSPPQAQTAERQPPKGKSKKKYVHHRWTSNELS